MWWSEQVRVVTTWAQIRKANLFKLCLWINFYWVGCSVLTQTPTRTHAHILHYNRLLQNTISMTWCAFVCVCACGKRERLRLGLCGGWQFIFVISLPLNSIESKWISRMCLSFRCLFKCTDTTEWILISISFVHVYLLLFFILAFWLPPNWTVCYKAYADTVNTTTTTKIYLVCWEW